MSLELVVFGEDWGGLPSSTQHIVGELIGRGHRVLWVNSIGLRRPRVSDLGRVIRKVSAAIGAAKTPARVRSGPAPTAILNPLAPPAPNSRLERTIARAMLGRQVRAAMARIDMRRPILWASLPSAAVALGACDERATVYYCGDDFGDLVGVDHGPALALERELVKGSDLVLAASPELARRFAGSNVETLPHGVDFNLFATPVSPDDTLTGGGRTAGFYGSMADWIDRDLMAEVATRLPSWRFQFIGAVTCDLGRLADLPNVQFLGPAPHAALPRFVQHWDAALLPFRDTPHIRACNPLKLREYLASGTPIVATPFPAAQAYCDLVHIAATPTAFTAAIEDCADQNAESKAYRQARVANETWENRATTVERLLERLAR